MSTVVRSLSPSFVGDLILPSWDGKDNPGSVSPYGIIYVLTNTVIGKVYVGQTIKPLEVRLAQHRNSARGTGRKCTYLANSILKYGVAAFKVAVVDRATSQEDLNIKERYWITKCDSVAPHGYNLKLGGDGGGALSEGVREKISRALKGKPLSAERRRYLSVVQRRRRAWERTRGIRRQFSLAARDRMRRAHLGKRQSQESVEKRASKLRGMPRSLEVRRKISEGHLRNPIPLTDQLRKQRSLNAKARWGRPLTEDERKRISHGQRARRAREEAARAEEDALLRKLYCEVGLALGDIAAAVGRSGGAVAKRVKKFHLRRSKAYLSSLRSLLGSSKGRQ